MPRSQRLLTAGLVGGALALLGSVAQGSARTTTAAARPSTIVLCRSIGVVTLGDSPRRVRRRLGSPTHLITLSGRVVQMDYERLGLDIHFNPGRAGDPVNFVSTGARRFRTAAGIHPGSTVAALKRAYRRLRGGGGTYSLLGKRGRARTDFNVAGRTIQSIDIQAPPRR